MQPPSPCGGNGGRATVLGSALTPLSLEGIPAMRNCKLRTVGENSKNSSTMVLRSSGHQLMNVAQDMKHWDETFPESGPFIRTPETDTFLRQFAITEVDSLTRCQHRHTKK